jgi:hypothetical protein
LVCLPAAVSSSSSRSRAFSPCSLALASTI